MKSKILKNDMHILKGLHYELDIRYIMTLTAVALFTSSTCKLITFRTKNLGDSPQRL